jgi:hypothetical protein
MGYAQPYLLEFKLEFKGTIYFEYCCYLQPHFSVING